MWIDIRDGRGDPQFSVQVSAQHPPTVVHPPDRETPKVLLNWERAVDDAGNLRRCPVCSCKDLYSYRRVPKMTAFALIVAAGLVAMVLLGMGQPVLAVVVLGVVIGIDVAVFLFLPRSLVCYRCRSQFRGLPGGRAGAHREWNSDTAERYEYLRQRTSNRGSVDVGRFK